MLVRLFKHLCANRRAAIICMLIGTVLFMFASALQQLGEGNVLAAVSSSLLMLVGVAGQLMGLLAIMKANRR